MSVPVLIFNQILLYEPIRPNHQPDQPPKSLCTDSVKCSLSFCPCSVKISLKVKKQNTQSTDHRTKVWCSASLICYKAAAAVVVRRERIYCGWRDGEKMTLQPEQSRCFCSPGRRKVRNLVTVCKCVMASSPTWMQTSSVFCFNVCHICLCHAMPCICAAVTRLISLLLAEWIKKTHIQCFSSVCSPPFHAVICAKGRIKAALPRSQPSLFRLVKEEKLGGHACFGGRGIAGFTLR